MGSNPVNPLSWNVAIVDPQTGFPTPEFQRKWAQQGSANAAAGSGTVTQVSATVPQEWAVNIATPSTTPVIAITKATQAANAVWAGPASGAAAQPAFRSLVAADLPLATGSAFGAVKPDGSTITISGGVISSSGGGASPGTPPTIVQSASSVALSASITLATAPVAGNLLVCIAGAGGTGVGSGWTSLTNNSGGADFLVICFKVAGASESATQTPLTSASAIAMTVWELHGQNASPFVFASALSNASAPFQATGNAPGLTNVLALAQVSTDGAAAATVGAALNMTQDQIINSGNRHLVAGHSNGAKPIAQLLTTFSVAEAAKAGIVLVTS